MSDPTGDQGGLQPSQPSRGERPPKLARKLFPSSDSSSQYDEEGWRQGNREDSKCSETGTTESWEFKSTQEVSGGHETAPIARLESLDELETSQVKLDFENQIKVSFTLKMEPIIDDKV